MSGTAAAELVDRLCRAVRDVPGDVELVARDHVGVVAPLADPAEREQIVAAAVARLSGLDQLADLMDDPAVDEILVNGSTEVWVERHGRLERRGSLPEGMIAVVVERILAPLGRRLDRTSPIVDARLPDGSRVCAAVPPVAVGGTHLSIRRLRTTAMPLSSFCDARTADVLHHVVEARCNVLVAGATSSGKTSLLGALLGLVDAGERVVVIEDTTELVAPLPHVVRLEARAATVDGVSEVSLGHLVRAALRLRPDRLVVGEVRGDEVLALVQALNTGHDGSLSTCHANGVLDALHRLETLVMQAAPTWPLTAVRSYLTRSIDVVVLVGRERGGRRRVVDVAEVTEHDGPPTVRTLVGGTATPVGLLRGRA